MKGKRQQVFQYTLDGELLEIHSSIIAASRDSGVAVESIKEYCEGKRTARNKYQWSYEFITL